MSSIALTETRTRESTKRLPWNFAEWFVVSQTLLPALLYLPGTQAFRVPIRMGCYGITLAALIYYWRSSKRSAHHPAVPWLIASMIYLTVMMAHPATNSLASGLAQIGLYFAVLAPVIWAPKLVESPVRLERLLWLLLICNGLSSIVGVLQVYDPARWMPAEFSSMFANSQFGLATVSYKGPDGQTIIRPPGLGDAPGAVAGAGILALFLGLVIAGRSRSFSTKSSALALAAFGGAAVFLTLVRSSFLIGLVMIACFIILQIRQGRVGTAVSTSLLCVGVIAVAFIGAFTLGGESISSRFSTILDANPVDFYADNRGNQVYYAFFEQLPEYPLGAGLGRWGMMYAYFGDPTNLFSPPIWAEIQWPAWIVDGGIILVLLSGAALLITLRHGVFHAVRFGDANMRSLSAIVVSVLCGLFALSFSYPVFASTTGIQFWFLAGSLHGVLQRSAGARPMRNF